MPTWIRTRCLFICYKDTKSVTSRLLVDMNIPASCKYRRPSAPVCPICEAGVEDIEHFILVSPTWHHLRSEFFRSVQVFSPPLAMASNLKVELHTGSYMSIGGNQSLLCLCKMYIWRQTKIVSWLNTTKKITCIENCIYCIPTLYILKFPLYWYMVMDMYICTYPSPRISDLYEYKHIYVNIFTRYIWIYT